MSLSYFIKELRQYDHDKYLLSLFAPAPTRAGLLALFFLNHEISKTRSVVSDTRLGHIRLQWWRDRISEIYAGGECGQIPVLSTLAPIIRDRALPQDLFNEIIYAREFDLEDVPPSNFDGLCRYAGFINAPMFMLALKIIGEKAEEGDVQAVSTYFGLQEIIRNTPFHLSRRQVLLPDEMLKERKLSATKILDFNYKEDIIDILKEIGAGVALPPKKTSSPFLNRARKMGEIYFHHLNKNAFDIFSAATQIPPPFLALRVWLTR